MADFSKEEIKNMFYAYHKSFGLDAFIELTAEKFYDLQGRILWLEKNKLSKKDLKDELKIRMASYDKMDKS